MARKQRSNDELSARSARRMRVLYGACITMAITAGFAGFSLWLGESWLGRFEGTIGFPLGIFVGAIVFYLVNQLRAPLEEAIRRSYDEMLLRPPRDW